MNYKYTFLMSIFILCSCTMQGALEPEVYNPLSIELQTEGGMMQGRSCRLYKEQRQGVGVAEYIVCDDGTQFDTPIAVEGNVSTMPVLNYVNYIGSYRKKQALLPLLMTILTPNSEQSEQKIMYFKGRPKRGHISQGREQ